MMRCVLPVLFLFISGCISSHTERMVDVSPLGWTPQAGITIAYNNHDTLSEHSIDLLLRWDDTFVCGELPCTITTIAPDSTIFNENVDFEIRKGRVLKHWTGYRDSQIGYRNGVVLSQSGTYKFVVQPTMPDPVMGLWAVGLNISK